MTPRIVHIILGRLGKGPADLTDLHGVLVSAGIHYDQAVAGTSIALQSLIEAGKVETASEGRGRYWRLAGSVPMDASAAVAATVPAGHIRAADFRASGRRK